MRRCPSGTFATPITYELGGRQYVSVLAGNGAGNSAPGRMFTFALDGDEPMPLTD
jgi:hypothetical protein